MFFSSSLSDAKTSLKRLLLQCIQIMGYDEFDSDSPSSNLSRMSGKKLTALVIVIILRVFFGTQALFGFPLKDLIRKEVTDDAKVVIKDDHGICIVEASDRQSHSISNCPYKGGDTLIVTFKEGTAPIEKYRLKI
jgi:hypothetical protein